MKHREDVSSQSSAQRAAVPSLQGRAIDDLAKLTGSLAQRDEAIGRLIENLNTVAGTVKGKFGYLAPEQLTSDRIDRRADIFSLGILIWECLTGSRLFGSTSPLRYLSVNVDGSM